MAPRRRPADEIAEHPLPLLRPADPAGAKAAPRSRTDATGHRDRLRRRLTEAGDEAFEDYELLELLLFGALPRVDTKPIAKELLRQFNNLPGVLAAPPKELKKVPGCGDSAVAILKATQAVARRMTRVAMEQVEVLGSFQAVLDYCQASMALETREEFRLIFLDIQNQVIRDERQQRGTVNHTPVYPREVVKRALELDASALIMVHNHPSGDPTPSRADIEMTKRVQEALAAVGITLHDHLIIGRGRHLSFRSERLL